MKLYGTGLLVVSLLLPAYATADVLSPTDETLAAMIAQSEEDIIFLGQQFGYPTGALTFTSQLDGLSKTYSYSLTPGSNYNGMSAALSGSGSFSAGLWTTTTNSTIGTTSWSADGTIFFADTQGGTGEDETADAAIPLPGGWDAHPRIHWDDDPTDPTSLISFGHILITFNGKVVASVNEADSRKKTIDELISQYAVVGLFDGAGSNDAATGAGRFVISPVPEPRSIALLAGAILLLLCVRYRTGQRGEG